jgi:hypothetical protein
MQGSDVMNTELMLHVTYSLYRCAWLLYELSTRFQYIDCTCDVSM